MGSKAHISHELLSCWEVSNGSPAEADYVLLRQFGNTFAARSRKGHSTLVIPLDSIGANVVGRRASGLELTGHSSAQFVHADRTWSGPAAALVCLNSELREVFSILAGDIAERTATDADLTWSTIVTLVEEWQNLLAARGTQSPESEVGLWGELWFIHESADVGRALAAWRGPDGDATDFFVDGAAVEVKTSRIRRVHQVSRTQVEEPAGDHPAWFLSAWVKTDPSSAMTVPSLVDGILERAPDKGMALRRLARAGYSPSERSSYTRAFVVLAEPEWYLAAEVPRVRAADRGVSHLRYQVALDGERCAGSLKARELWAHFHGQEYGGNRK